MRSGEIFSFFFWDFSTSPEVRFVAYENQDQILARASAGFLNEAVKLSEGLSICDIEGEDGSDSSSEVGPSDGPERLLTGGIPNLQFNYFVPNV